MHGIDFFRSRAVTGNLFFAPTVTFLDQVTVDEAPAPSPAREPAQPIPTTADGSLGIGSLKGDPPA